MRSQILARSLATFVIKKLNLLNTAAENMLNQKDGESVQQEMKNIFRPRTPRCDIMCYIVIILILILNELMILIRQYFSENLR